LGGLFFVVAILALLSTPYAAITFVVGTAWGTRRDEHRAPGAVLHRDLGIGLVVVNIRHGMRRITGLAIVGTVAALLVGGCSSSSTGQLGVNRPAALTASCPASSSGTLGLGSGPVYLSGQSSWYSEGQVVILMVDSKYTGPLLVRGSELGGDGRLRITLADLPPTDLANIAAKESQHSVALVLAVHTPEGGLKLPADVGSPSWRAWFGRLSTDGPGCFAIRVDGTAFTEVIQFAVHAGPAPPG
jgi:hypothetical protein